MPPTPPTENAEAVDHRGMAVGSHERVRVGLKRAGAFLGRGLHNAGQILEVDLVDDAGCGRDNAEVVEGALPPLEKLVALAVALKLTLGIEKERGRRAEPVHLYRVVYDQIDWHDRVYLVGIAAHAGHGAAQRGQVDDTGHAGKILKDDPRRLERDLDFAGGIRAPTGNGLDRVLGDLEALGLAQGGLQQHFDGEWQPVHIGRRQPFE